MQDWINLERLRSPLLQGGMPETLPEFAAAARVFGLAIDELSAEEMARIGSAMRRTIAEAFAVNLPMRPENSAAAERGFGAWLPIFTALLAECGLQPAEACALPVGQAFALLAGLRHAQGWKLAGTSYASARPTFNEATEDAADA